MGDLVGVQTGFGAYTHEIVGVPQNGANGELLLSHNRLPQENGCPSSFTGGQSGSPVVNSKGEVVAVVRDNAGHCGLVIV
jgi:hypothetical protein